MTRDTEPTKKRRQIGKDASTNKKITEEYEVYLWRCKGLISNYRCCRTWKRVFNEGTGREENRERAITFCTIGYDNAKYIDIVLHGKIGLGKHHLIEGIGIMQDEAHAAWLKVEKWQPISL